MQATITPILKSVATVGLLWTMLVVHNHATATGDEALQNVILLIGDGLGTTQITAARLYVRATTGALELEQMPVTGLVKTASADDVITDSAAAGTALATGFKTRNGMISQNPEGRDLYTILEAARDRDMGTGIVVTSSITHATPAVFAAHNGNRDNETEIAVDLLRSNVDVLLGGGRAFFIPKDRAGSRRSDNLDLILEAQNKGYQLVENRADLLSAAGPKILGLFQLQELQTRYPQSVFRGSWSETLIALKEKVLALVRNEQPLAIPQEPSLAEMTARAIKVLSQHENGFFLVVEGSHIDWGGHANDAEFMIQQVLLFDEAVAVARAFAGENGRTLVLVTADHETGGMSITGADRYAWATGEHTALDVPVYADGPHAMNFTGVMDNTDIAKKLGRLLGLVDFPRQVMAEP